MPLDLCMVFISGGGVLTAWNNCKMSKSCYSSHLMRIAVDISHWCIIYAMQSWSSSSNRYEVCYSGMHIIWSKHRGLQYFRRSGHFIFFKFLQWSRHVLAMSVNVFTVHSESMQTLSLFSPFVKLQPYAKIIFFLIFLLINLHSIHYKDKVKST